MLTRTARIMGSNPSYFPMKSLLLTGQREQLHETDFCKRTQDPACGLATTKDEYLVFATTYFHSSFDWSLRLICSVVYSSVLLLIYLSLVFVNLFVFNLFLYSAFFHATKSFINSIRHESFINSIIIRLIFLLVCGFSAASSFIRVIRVVCCPIPSFVSSFIN